MMPLMTEQVNFQSVTRKNYKQASKRGKEGDKQNIIGEEKDGQTAKCKISGILTFSLSPFTFTRFSSNQYIFFAKMRFSSQGSLYKRGSYLLAMVLHFRHPL